MIRNFFNLLGAKTALTLGFMVALVFLTGCLDDDGNPDPVQLAYISIYHASPTTEDVDIRVGNYPTPINNNPFEYGDYTSYMNIHPGEWDFEFTESGDNDEVLIDTTLTIENYKNYTLFLTDAVVGPETIMLTDSAETPGTGKAMIRFVHLSPDTEEINVVADDEDLFEGYAYKDATAFKEVDAGTITFKFQGADSEEVLLTTPNTEIKTGQYYTMILKGFSSPPEGNNNELSTDIYKN